MLKYVVGDLAQTPVVHGGGRQRDREYGNVVHVHRFYQRLLRARGHAVKVAHDAIVEFNQGVFFVLSHVELHAHYTHRIHGDAVGMLHAAHALQYGLQGLNDELFDFLGRCPRFGDNDIGRRHHDLGILLARCHSNGEYAR